MPNLSDERLYGRCDFCGAPYATRQELPNPGLGGIWMHPYTGNVCRECAVKQMQIASGGRLVPAAELEAARAERDEARDNLRIEGETNIAQISHLRQLIAEHEARAKRVCSELEGVRTECAALKVEIARLMFPGCHDVRGLYDDEPEQEATCEQD